MGEVLYITGTDTGVGKTVATAALAASISRGGRSVAVYKPTQAGLEDGAGDIDTVRRLSGIAAVSEGVRLEFPMAPVAAAERQGVELPPADAHIAAIGQLAHRHDVVLVEGAGGLLVELDFNRATLADLADDGGRFIVVCRAALGTLNHTLLTLEALRARRRHLAGLIIGAWPAEPDAIDRSNRDYFTALDTPILGVIPAGAGAMEAEAFRAAAPEWVRLGSDAPA